MSRVGGRRRARPFYRVDPNTLKLLLPHYWIMVLSSAQQQQKLQRKKLTNSNSSNSHRFHHHHRASSGQHQQQRKDHGNQGNSQLHEAASPFEAFTGYKLYSSTTIASSATSQQHQHSHQPKQHCRSSNQHPRQATANSPAAEAALVNMGKHLLPLPSESREDRYHHRVGSGNGCRSGAGAGGKKGRVFPSEIYVCDGHDLPHTITVDERDAEDVASEVSLEDGLFSNCQGFAHLNETITNCTESATTDYDTSNKHLVIPPPPPPPPPPPLSMDHRDVSFLCASPCFSKHAIKASPRKMFHDPTWGIRVTNLDDTCWPSDEEGEGDDDNEGRDDRDDQANCCTNKPKPSPKALPASRARTNMVMCTDVFYGMDPCSGLQFWSKGQVNEQNLTAATNPADAPPSPRRDAAAPAVDVGEQDAPAQYSASRCVREDWVPTRCGTPNKYYWNCHHHPKKGKTVDKNVRSHRRDHSSPATCTSSYESFPIPKPSRSFHSTPGHA